MSMIYFLSGAEYSSIYSKYLIALLIFNPKHIRTDNLFPLTDEPQLEQQMLLVVCGDGWTFSLKVYPIDKGKEGKNENNSNFR